MEEPRLIRARYRFYPPVGASNGLTPLVQEFEVDGTFEDCESQAQEILAAGYTCFDPAELAALQHQGAQPAQQLGEGEKATRANCYVLHKYKNGTVGAYLYHTSKAFRVGYVYQEQMYLLPFIPDDRAKVHTSKATLERDDAKEEGFLMPCCDFEFVKTLVPKKSEEGMDSYPFSHTLRVFDDYGRPIQNWLTAADQRALADEAAQQKKTPPPAQKKATTPTTPPPSSPIPPPDQDIDFSVSDNPSWPPPGSFTEPPPEAEELGDNWDAPPEDLTPDPIKAKRLEVEDKIKASFPGEVDEVLIWACSVACSRTDQATVGTIDELSSTALDYLHDAITKRLSTLQKAWIDRKERLAKQAAPPASKPHTHYTH